jgi:hypothetical protein
MGTKILTDLMSVSSICIFRLRPLAAGLVCSVEAKVLFFGPSLPAPAYQTCAIHDRTLVYRPQKRVCLTS